MGLDWRLLSGSDETHRRIDAYSKAVVGGGGATGLTEKRPRTQTMTLALLALVQKKTQHHLTL